MGEVGSKYLLLFLLGGLGVWARMFMTQSLNVAHFPYGTLIVNILGSSIIGVLFGLDQRGVLPWSPAVQTAIIVGGLGALTTFSSFSLETLRLFQVGAYQKAIFNISINNVAAIAFCYLGWKLSRGEITVP